MELDPAWVPLTQPPLFDFGQPSSGALELFPSLWGALEALTYPQAEARSEAIARIVELNAVRFSPLVAYILATRIMDPNLTNRVWIIRLLAGVLTPDEAGQPAPEAVRTVLNHYLASLRIRPIFGLLQAADSEDDLDAAVSTLLNACPYAGAHLAEILGNRRNPLAIRKQAANYIGLVGYCDAIPTLERMAGRLETRLSGQEAMPFAPSDGNEEVILLPEIRKALDLLQAP